MPILLAVGLDRERRDPSLAHRRDLGLHGTLDVLRVEVVASDDEHVLQAPGDVQLTAAQKAQIAGAQPGAAIALDEGRCRGLGVAPVAVSDARPGSPDFTDLVISQCLAAGRVDDRHRMLRLAAATAHQHAVFTRSDAVARQRLAIHRQRRDPLPALPSGDEQRRFGQAVAGEETGGVETAGGELPGEVLQAVLTNRLGAGERDPPAAQVETFQRGFGHPLAAQTVGEVRPATDGAAVTADGLQPAQWPGEEILRRHQHAGNTAEDRLQQTTDQAHVVVQRQPADDHVIVADAETSTDQHLVGNQVAMADLHPLGQRSGARGVLEEGDMLAPSAGSSQASAPARSS